MGRVLGVDAIRGAAALMIPLFHTLLYINEGGVIVCCLICYRLYKYLFLCLLADM